MTNAELFKEHKDFLKFEKVTRSRTSRPDLHAFLLLDELFPQRIECTGDLIDGAEHDQIWLSVKEHQIQQLTPEQIAELSMCGVWYDEECDSLTMYV